MQFASFDLADPLFECFGRRISFQLVTLENLYGLDPARARVEASGDAWTLRADGLACAGQEQRAAGSFEAVVRREGEGSLRVRIRARAPAPIRCVKWLVRDLDPDLAVRRSDDSD